MKPVFQTLIPARDGAGNCVTACLASIFELPLDQVPDMRGPNTTPEQWEAYQQFLHGRNLSLRFVAMPSPHDHPKYQPYLGIGEVQGSKERHCTVWEKGQMIHDPWPEDLEGFPRPRLSKLVNVSWFVPIKR